MINIIDKILLIVIYLLFGLIVAIMNIYMMKKNKKLSVNILLNGYFSLVYIITPICVLIKNGKIPYYIYTNNIKYYYWILINAIASYVALNIGYSIRIKDENYSKEKCRNLLLSGYVLLAIGWIALFLWTKAYGSLVGIFKYSSLIRSGYVIIYNKYTFLKPFCAILLFSFAIFYSKLLGLKNYNLLKKCLTIIGLIFSTIGSYIYIIANDGRMIIILILLTVIMPLIEKKNNKINLRKIIGYIICGIIMIIILGQLDNVTYYLKNKKRRKVEDNNNIITIIADELGYTYSNNININYLRNEGVINEYTLFSDIKNIMFAWVPQRFKPKDVINLFDYNTTFYKRTTGQIPTDIITASIYKFGIIGVIILPLIVGIFFKILEKKIFKKREKSDYYLVTAYLITTYLGLRFIAYYDLSQILFGSFYIIISIIIVKIISKINMDR